jgi:hypothetical protein
LTLHEEIAQKNRQIVIAEETTQRQNELHEEEKLKQEAMIKPLLEEKRLLSNQWRTVPIRSSRAEIRYIARSKSAPFINVEFTSPHPPWRRRVDKDPIGFDKLADVGSTVRVGPVGEIHLHQCYPNTIFAGVIDDKLSEAKFHRVRMRKLSDLTLKFV